jgi:hypothetical protein
LGDDPGAIVEWIKTGRRGEVYLDQHPKKEENSTPLIGFIFQQGMYQCYGLGDLPETRLLEERARLMVGREVEGHEDWWIDFFNLALKG